MTYKGYLIDLDGIFTRGRTAISEGEAFVKGYKRQIPYLFHSD